ncbi:CsgG/HfaB family protein [Candidatus Neomarinimicrobiota bacterium]
MLSAQSESIAILDLDGRGISKFEAESLTDRLRSEMVKTGRITVVERGQMEQILSEQDFTTLGCTSDECAVEVGQLLGVTRMLAGSIGKVGSTFSLDIRTIDVTTGEIFNSITRDYRGEIDGLLVQMGLIAREVVDLEAPQLSPTPLQAVAPAIVEHQPTTTPTASKGGFKLKWLAYGAIAIGGGYLGYMALTETDEPASENVGTPPGLPVLP